MESHSGQINPAGSRNCTPGNVCCHLWLRGQQCLVLLPRLRMGSGSWLELWQALAEYLHHIWVFAGYCAWFHGPLTGLEADAHWCESCGTEAAVALGDSPEDALMQGESWLSIDREEAAGEYKEAALCWPHTVQGSLKARHGAEEALQQEGSVSGQFWLQCTKIRELHRYLSVNRDQKQS